MMTRKNSLGGLCYLEALESVITMIIRRFSIGRLNDEKHKNH